MPTEEELNQRELELKQREMELQKTNSEIIGKSISDLDVSDPNHYLYLHHSDHPNYSLATQLLSDSNYHQWKRSVEVSLMAKNKFIFVIGGSRCLDPGSALEMQWKRCNSMVISWLIHSVEKEISETLLYYDTAADIWSDLSSRFGQPSLARTYQVQKELFNISQGSLPISSYYTKFKRYWDEYLVLVEMPKCESCGKLNSVPKMMLNQKVLQFLVGLNESYSAVRANALMMKPTPTIGDVYQMALQEEKQKSLTANSAPLNPNSSAFSAYSKQGQSSTNSHQNAGQNFNPKSTNEGTNQQAGQGSNASNTRSANSGQRTKPYYFCDNCKVPGHSISRCFKIHGYPKDFKEKKFAGNATVHDEGKENADKSHNLTKTQYERLIALLEHQQVGGSTTDTSKSCMMAGPFHEQSSGAW